MNAPVAGGAAGRSRVTGPQVLRALAMFRHVAAVDVDDLAARLGTSPETAAELLALLADERFTEPGDDGRHVPGQVLRDIGRALHGAGGLVDLAHPVLQSLVAESGETAQLAVREGGAVRVIDAVESPRMLRVGGDVGHVVTVPESLAAALLATGDGGPASTFDPARDTGISTVALAVPGTDAALGLAAPVSRMDRERHEHHVTLLTAAAAQLAAVLAGGSVPPPRPARSSARGAP